MTSKAFDNATDANRQQGGRRNLIINGAMQVAQRGTSFSGNQEQYGADRFVFVETDSTAVVTVSNSSNAPEGFSNSIRVEVDTANGSLDANGYLHLYHAHEGQDLQQLKFGTSNAESITISFWIRTNKAGTYQYNLYNTDGGRQIAQTFTLLGNEAWVQKTLTFSGDTSSGFTNDNTTGLRHLILFAAGSNFNSGSVPTSWTAHSTADRGAGLTANLLDTIGNYVEITGVQLEVGTVATPFEHRSYGEELALCQRYYQRFDNGATGTIFSIGHAYSSSAVNAPFHFLVEMRTPPTGTIEQSYWRIRNSVGSSGTMTGATIVTTRKYGHINAERIGAGLSAGDAAQVWSVSGSLELDAEL